MRAIAGVAIARVALSIPAHAQLIAVAVAVQDTAAAGILQSGFASAFRSLGDVDVVTVAENPDYVLSGVVVCSPEPCEHAITYSIALRLFEPIRRSTADFLAEYAVNPRGTERTAMGDSLSTVIWSLIEGYERTHITWVARWGRHAYEQAIRELVAEIDSQCLDKLRASRRMLPPTAGGSPSERLARYQHFIASRNWLC